MGSKRKTTRRRSGNPALRAAGPRRDAQAAAAVPHQSVDPGIVLRGDGRVDVNLGTGASLPAVLFSLETPFPPERRRELREGWGYRIELPAVLDLLHLVEDGRADPGQARELLLRAARELYIPFEAHLYEDEDTLKDRCLRDPLDCPVCRTHRSGFDSALDVADIRWARYTEPEKYPFIAGSRGLHEVGCSVVRREMPQNYARPAGATYTSELRRHAHRPEHLSYRSPLEESRDYPRWSAMTVAEARAWTAERTGPKGGRSYRTCSRCAPAP
ncbi:hypothetical protein ACIPYS_20850 [Kitasatospora sp. NPDC089913]|uniref:hypothetical protein n=1 Tax=Kitasatospora sp. NPDC089913 TaxID=3364080 RepID=UPI00381877EA